MASKTPTGRASKGSVSVILSNGRLQLRFHFARKRYYISTGYPDTPHHRKLAKLKASEIEKDILFERFDPKDLGKYKSEFDNRHITPSSTPSVSQPTLPQLWEKYTDFKRLSLSPSTLAKDYTKIARCVELQLPSKSLNDAIAIRDWLVANKTANSAKRIVTQLAACCQWALKSQMISHNPFKGMASEIKIPACQSDSSDINPFTLEERDKIIQTFKNNNSYNYYAALIEFLFMSGCRPSEAIALQWKHISEDFRTIKFEQAVVEAEEGLVCKKGLKTQKKRSFPANKKLAALLESIKPKDATGETKVFPSPKDKWIDVHNLTTRVWRSVLKELEDIIEYRKLYQTRHTFITAALETPIPTADGRTKMLDAKDVAKLVGTSPKMIYEHYAGASKELFVPEF
ncbi:MAG: tyrosine-type recombinase/integrase [Richelia sp. RM2_1_2]|nr:tyrosine-type recombinase/integrase [Richelia sp. SM1_7_0]NJN08132.1 tyrosine-type recombinase/integrase [Richelia sp. RM1_1_1]NJO27414.1 tyrosine-type recombinase/integrase [Richelia sp. SL_2_1]NJO62030.1 tyrosine-type recombinase/integrase [Richelia sp. RM2_1_2]